MLHKRLKYPSCARCFICSLNNLTMFNVHLYSPLSGGALPFAVDQKEEKVLSKSSFLPPHGFLFPAHIPEKKSFLHFHMHLDKVSKLSKLK